MLCVGLAVSGCYDDSALKETLKDHEERIFALEALCAQLNTNQTSLQTVIDALDSNDYVTGVAPIVEGNKTIGYTLTFKNSGSVTIYMNSDMPMLRVQDGTWYVSYDEGVTWEKAGEAIVDTEDTYITDVEVDCQYLTLTLSDGNAIKIPLANLPPVLTVVPNRRTVRFCGKTFPTAVDYRVGVIVGDEEWVKEAIAEGESDGIAYDFAEDGSFEIVTLCDVDSENLYRAYAYANGTYSWSELMTFESNNAEMEYEVSDIKGSSAQLTGKVQLKFPDNDAVVAVRYGTETYESYGRLYIHGEEVEIELAPDGTFAMTMDNLRSATQYYFYVFVRYDQEMRSDESGYWYDDQIGNCLAFTTLDAYESLQDLDETHATDLSSFDSANCYIVSEGGLYKFRAVKGNDADQTLEDAASASILWESFGTSETPKPYDLLSGVSYSNGYVVFQTAEVFKEGNAVIAAKDADGNILWSWHIWLTDQPEEQVYYNDAGTMMDRNLGATSATPGDVGALGLLYQWGRKDPFLGSSNIRVPVLAESTITWPSADYTNDIIEFVIANPTAMIYNIIFDASWTTAEASKSIYDPCPVGWRVPDGGDNGVWVKALGTSSPVDYTYDIPNEGVNFSGKFGSASTIWYPAPGWRYDNGEFCMDYDDNFNFCGYGKYWSASPSIFASSYACCLDFSEDGYFDQSSGFVRSDGCSVRCQKE